MHEVTAIRVPFDNVNDETVKLLAWLVEEGQEVFEGQILAEVETSKAVVEMTAPVAGRVSLKAKAGDDVRVGDGDCLYRSRWAGRSRAIREERKKREVGGARGNHAQRQAKARMRFHRSHFQQEGVRVDRKA